jgi:hypothetical protein
MTYIDEPEVRRTSRGTKVLGFGVAILAVLGSFWGIVWFIRSYVEPPRVMMPSPLALAARDSTPVTLPQPRRTEPPDDLVTASAPPAALTIPDPPDRAKSSGGIADRWAPISQAAPATTQVSPATREAALATSAPLAAAPTIAAAPATLAVAEPAPLPTMSAATSLTTPIAAPNPDAGEEVAESFIPAINNPAPLPRRKPVMTAVAKRNIAEPPLPRPRPDGPAPQSVFTAVPVADERFPTQ